MQFTRNATKPNRNHPITLKVTTKTTNPKPCVCTWVARERWSLGKTEKMFSHNWIALNCYNNTFRWLAGWQWQSRSHTRLAQTAIAAGSETKERFLHSICSYCATPHFFAEQKQAHAIDRAESIEGARGVWATFFKYWFSHIGHRVATNSGKHEMCLPLIILEGTLANLKKFINAAINRGMQQSCTANGLTFNLL